MHFDCGRSRKTRNLIQKSCQETPYRDLRSCQDTSYGDLVQRHCVEICCKDLSQVSYINLAQKAFVERERARRSHKEILPRDILSRGLAKRPLLEIWTEVLPRGPLQRSCDRALIEILYRDLARRPLMEILYRDLGKRAEVLLGDHVEIPRTEILL